MSSSKPLDLYSDELSAAVLLLAESQTADAVENACNAILASYTPDLWTASRLLLGLSSKVSTIKIDSHRMGTVTSVALRMIAVCIRDISSSESTINKDAADILKLLEEYAL